MDKQCTIYLITNKINNKKYVGFTRYKNPIKRFRKHLSIAEKGPICKCFSALHSAINEHKKENFNFQIIYQSTDEEYTLKVMEPYYIKLHESFGLNGYNLTIGGEGILGYKHTNETKKKIKEKRATQIMNIIGRVKLSEHGKKDSESYNKRFTKETRSKLSISQSNRMKNGYNPKATKWIVKDNKNNLQEITKPTTHFGSAFKSFWASHRDNRPIQRGNYEGWQLIEIVKL